MLRLGRTHDVHSLAALWKRPALRASMGKEDGELRRRKRLLRGTRGWNGGVAGRFVRACTFRARDHAVRALRAAGLHDQAEELASVAESVREEDGTERRVQAMELGGAAARVAEAVEAVAEKEPGPKRGLYEVAALATRNVSGAGIPFFRRDDLTMAAYSAARSSIAAVGAGVFADWAELVAAGTDRDAAASSVMKEAPSYQAELDWQAGWLVEHLAGDANP